MQRLQLAILVLALATLGQAPACKGSTGKATGTNCTTACSPGAGCTSPSQCASRVCSQGVCQEPTCTDGVMNGQELGVDCGGFCRPCGCGVNDCVKANFNCGPIGDGCSGIIQCGNCTSPDICGGLGQPGVCGTPTHCTPTTCQAANATCGPLGDGCGNALNCGTCTASGTACVNNSCVSGGGQCTNLCLQEATCTTGATTISGIAYAPTTPPYWPSGRGPDPLYNALVYVPNAAVSPFTPGVSCNGCDAAASGSPVVIGLTGVNGAFTLGDPSQPLSAPDGNNIPLVIQMGYWRRQVTIPHVTACTNNVLPDPLTCGAIDTQLACQSANCAWNPAVTPSCETLVRLPRTQLGGVHGGNGEGDIPLIGLTTGSADSVECVLPKIGIDTTELTDPSGNGRVRFYHDNGATNIGSTTLPAATNLYDNYSELAKYNMIIFDCVGGQHDKTGPELQHVLDYTANGGRVFATHYEYVWLYNNSPFGCGSQSFPCPAGPPATWTTAHWHVDQGHPADPNTQNANLVTSFPKGLAFSQWLGGLGSLTTASPPQISMSYLRHDFDSPVSSAPACGANATCAACGAVYGCIWSGTCGTPDVGTCIATGVQLWAADSGGNPIEYTFNTPVDKPPANQCGRVLFSDFHVYNKSGGNTFPDYCTVGPLSAQEQILEFQIFDLTNCVSSDQSTPCTPKGCGSKCGPQSDGCGNIIQCASCVPPASCGGGGVPNICGTPVVCKPLTTCPAGTDCGPLGDGCGGLIYCCATPPCSVSNSACTSPAVCGGGGVANQCGNPG